MTHPMKMLSALLGGKSKKEIIAMMDDDQREIILQNMPTLHLSRVERRRMERGLKKRKSCCKSYSKL